jgi:hypothetical protein
LRQLEGSAGLQIAVLLILLLPGAYVSEVWAVIVYGIVLLFTPHFASLASQIMLPMMLLACSLLFPIVRTSNTHTT